MPAANLEGISKFDVKDDNGSQHNYEEEDIPFKQGPGMLTWKVKFHQTTLKLKTKQTATANSQPNMDDL